MAKVWPDFILFLLTSGSYSDGDTRYEIAAMWTTELLVLHILTGGYKPH